MRLRVEHFAPCYARSNGKCIREQGRPRGRGVRKGPQLVGGELHAASEGGILCDVCDVDVGLIAMERVYKLPVH